MIELRPDQQEALQAVLTAYKQRPEDGKALIVAATGWGKTVFFSSLARELKSINILILAHRDELLDQAREKLQMVDSSAIVGKVGGGSYEWGAPITVAGVDTISRDKHLKNLHKFNYKLIIVDECHHAPAPKYQKVLNALPNAFRLGVTATPERLDGKSLEPIFGKPLFRMDIKDAIQQGLLSDIRSIAIRTETSLDNIKSSRNADGEIDFNQKELENAIDTPARNQRIVEAYQEHAVGRRTICFCVSVEHAHNVAEAFNQAGIPAAVVSGTTSLTERARLYSQLRDGSLKVLTNVLVLTEGFDLPAVDCVIMARPTQSNSLYIQCIGRGARRAPNKIYCLILDITDNCYRLRLSPQNISKALGLKINGGELLTEAIEREEKEKAEQEAREKRALIRKLNERRHEDKEIDLFALPEWQEKPGGLYVLEVGPRKHRIALVPCSSSGWTQLYDVCARLAPDFQGQRWLKAQPLDYALQYAEKRAHQLLEDPGSVKLLDRNAAWRSQPLDPAGKQAKMLRWYRIPIRDGMTKGEASDLIGEHKAKLEQKKARKAAKQREETA